jgi:serine/threonine protein kinase
MTDPAHAHERYCPTCEQSFPAGERCPTDGTQLVVLGSGPDPLLGRDLEGRYTISARLGAGGMGTVYRGLQHSVGRDVAIKVVSPGLVSDPMVIKRFLREAKLASRLSHPNAVSILDFGQTRDGLFFLVMELLVGRTLDRLLRDEIRLAPPRLVTLAGQICDALDGAHRHGVVHRDLKPSNIMVLRGAGDRELIKVLDFGLAKSLSVENTSTTMTASGALLGTPAFMSPEAALGTDAGPAADLYSLGCVLYAAASGRLPFEHTTIHELIAAHAVEPPPPVVGVPPALGAVIMRLLAKDPADRYASAAETRHALEAALARHDSTPAVDVTLPPTASAERMAAATLATGPGLALAATITPATPVMRGAERGERGERGEVRRARRRRRARHRRRPR